MSQADAEHRECSPQLANDVKRAACFVRSTRTGREHDRQGRQLSDVLHFELVIAHDVCFMPQPLKVASQVENKAVVVVDQ